MVYRSRRRQCAAGADSFAGPPRHPALAMFVIMVRLMPSLSDLEVLIVDCQTTGATPALGAVLELGWGVARASRTELE